MADGGCCGGCFAALRRGGGKKRTAAGGTGGSLAPDLVAGVEARRFASPGGKKPTVDEVLKMVRPRPTPTAPGPLGVQQSWASPVPRAGLGASSMQDRERMGEALAISIDEIVVAAGGASAQAGKVAEAASTAATLRPVDVNKFQVEQLVSSPGSLPPALQPYEREQVIRRLLPTATHEMLAKLPRHLAEASGLEGQTLRRRLVAGSTVVFFTAGYAGKRFVFERAAQLGVRSVVIEHPDSWAKGMVKEGLISKFLPVDMSQSADQVLQQSLELIKGLGQDGVTGEADGVITLVELSVPLVARLCERLGLPGPPPAAVDAARDKHATRGVLKKAGLPTPKNYLIRSEAELGDAALHVGFPAVLKPVSGAASLGVAKVTSQNELMEVYRKVIGELKSLVVISGALVQNDGSGQGVQADQVVNLQVLLEQYLDGPEVDVDLVVSDGEWRYAAITDNGPTVEPWFNETWGVCPSLLPLEKQRELKDLSVACVKALGFSSGVFHVECKYTSKGPQLVEVNARMGGGPVHEHNLRTWGVDLVEETIFIGLGIPARPYTPKVPLEPVGYYLVPATKSGVVEEVPDIAALARRPEVVWAKSLVKKGDKVTGPAEGMPTWLMDIMVKGPGAQEAVDAVFRLEEEFRVKVR